MELGLRGKTVIVTGGGRGLGKIVVTMLAEEGANVVIAELDEQTGIQTAEEIIAKGGKALMVKTDISDPRQTENMVKAALDRFDGVYGLVNNATVISAGKPFLEETMDEVTREVNVIYYGASNCMRAVLGPMRDRKEGAIVNVLTDAARIGERRMANYAGAKAGVGGLSRSLAKEYAPYNIRINCVAPASMMTELNRQIRAEELQKVGPEKFAAMQKKRLSLYPLGEARGELGRPEDVAHAILFFLSNKTSWVTGQSLSVDGGYAIGPW
ncbi:MAG: SDR family oxidoreductase [Chloroflexota bacterium]|nr:MAG: SDR family oxidoreductase [Chloroflexota bacterium]